jgi:ring-1,2-phenylacetyl-CoA epoxidase subunit PaaE
VADVVYHPLAVAAVDTLTDDSVAITLEVPQTLADTFRFLPGQHIGVKADIAGQDVRRTYSVCTDPAEGRLRIGVKRIPDGLFSTYATSRLQPGDRIEVSPPHGDFLIAPAPGTVRHYAAIAAGSGITPVLAMIAAVLNTEQKSKFTLLFGNRTSRSVMFLEELEGLKDRYPDRFHLIHVLSREAQTAPILSGRLDVSRLDALLAGLVDVDSVDGWYLCGPFEMVGAARQALADRGVDPAAIHDELFFSDPTPPVPPPSDENTAGAVRLRFTLDGRTTTTTVDPDGPPILSYALNERRDTPFSCRGGMCTTCRARIIEGTAEMELNFALTTEDLAKGYLLTCQAHPTSDTLEITYDV